jgi:hypothetical protein
MDHLEREVFELLSQPGGTEKFIAQERARETKEKEAALSMPVADKDGSFRYPGFADPALQN